MRLTWVAFKQAVRERLEHDGASHLHPVFDDLYGIGKRIRDVDDTLFIVRNVKTAKYEVHCLLHRPDSIAWVVPWPSLDARVIQKAQYNRADRTTASEFLREIHEHNERLEEQSDRDFRNFTEAFAYETRPLWMKLADGRGR